jgi:glyoxylase-like metal-dependent hydrolase (beta-lactamase superfamily II)
MRKLILFMVGSAIFSLASFVKKLTSKPLIVVNTHGHPDHAGANYQFEKVYVYPADFINNQVAYVKGILDGTLERKPYQSFAGNAMVSVSGRASVAFNPGNL